MARKSSHSHSKPLHPLERRVLAEIRRQGLIAPGERGMVSLSGGPDSMALLHILHALSGALGIARLEVVHFDHGLRPESAGEADWVAGEAARLERPLHMVRTGHLAALTGGVQAAARDWRRTESARLMAQWEADWMATGHQREDRLETWLMKLLRGTHLSHLGGMAWRNGPFIRPLLRTPRAGLKAYLEDKGQGWLEDPTNALPRYKRNRVRHELLPLLDDLTGGGGARPLAALERRLDALERQARQLETWLGEVRAGHPVSQNDPAEPRHWISAPELAALPELAANDALHRFITERMPGAVPFGQMERAAALLRDGKPRWRLHLPGRRLLKRDGERIVLERLPGAGEAAEAAEAAHAPVCMEFMDLRVWKPKAWRVNLFQAPPGMEATEDIDPGFLGLALFNLPPGATLELRPRRPGDRFHPPWKDKPVKLKEFLRERKIPLDQRDRVALVVLDERVIGLLPPDAPAAGSAPALAARGHHQPDGESPALWVGVEIEVG
ncbi:MAG: tRNA lysidine(34) synthetase TilS [SAR324 cluster bacterium]|nr:tRNA lysidine(34) synthetase TilS [SAR324 cluster bacterium]